MAATLPSQELRGVFPDELIADKSLEELQDDLERSYLLKMCRQTGGDIHALTQALGVKRAGLYRRFQRIGLDVKKMRDGL
jgi:DNA-binding NtrC family response regulator